MRRNSQRDDGAAPLCSREHARGRGKTASATRRHARALCCGRYMGCQLARRQVGVLVPRSVCHRFTDGTTRTISYINKQPSPPPAQILCMLTYPPNRLIVIKNRLSWTRVRLRMLDFSSRDAAQDFARLLQQPCYEARKEVLQQSVSLCRQ